MTWTPEQGEQFYQLSEAEEYFTFFDLPYDPRIVNVNRLHILRKFSQLILEINAQEADPALRLPRYREALQQSYEVFLTSTSYEQKLFKVFQEPPPNMVLVSEIGIEEGD